MRNETGIKHDQHRVLQGKVKPGKDISYWPGAGSVADDVLGGKLTPYRSAHGAVAEVLNVMAIGKRVVTFNPIDWFCVGRWQCDYGF